MVEMEYGTEEYQKDSYVKDGLFWVFFLLFFIPLCLYFYSWKILLLFLLYGFIDRLHGDLTFLNGLNKSLHEYGTGVKNALDDIYDKIEQLQEQNANVDFKISKKLEERLKKEKIGDKK